MRATTLLLLGLCLGAWTLAPLELLGIFAGPVLVGAWLTLRERASAFAHAVEIAPQRGAGTLVYVGRFDLAEFAVVLEPEEPLSMARRAFFRSTENLAVPSR